MARGHIPRGRHPRDLRGRFHRDHRGRGRGDGRFERPLPNRIRKHGYRGPPVIKQTEVTRPDGTIIMTKEKVNGWKKVEEKMPNGGSSIFITYPHGGSTSIEIYIQEDGSRVTTREHVNGTDHGSSHVTFEQTDGTTTDVRTNAAQTIVQTTTSINNHISSTLITDTSSDDGRTRITSITYHDEGVKAEISEMTGDAEPVFVSMSTRTMEGAILMKSYDSYGDVVVVKEAPRGRHVGATRFFEFDIPSRD